MQLNKRQTVLVTGGAGFIGSHLCGELLKKGYRVICLDNLYTGREENIDLYKNDPNFTFVEHDICNPIALDGPLDQIYNLACPASPPHYQADPIKTMKTSILGALNVLELAKNKNARILQASTSEVYGDPDIHPQPETYWGKVNPIGIRSCYDEGKRSAETLFFDYHRQYGVDIRVIRIFNTYGPNMRADDGRVVSNFINQALRNDDITIYGDGSQTRSFQYVSDLVAGMLAMMENQKGFIGPVNLGNPDEFTMRELAERVMQLVPKSRSRIVYKKLPQDDPRQRKPDITLAKRELDWSPDVNLNTGLKKTIEYFSKT
jgi:UDP-glucuronate decarboxylase